MPRSVVRVLTGAAIVLTIAAGGVVARGALPTEAARPGGSPQVGPGDSDGKPAEFSLSALQSRKVPQGWSVIAAPKRRSVQVHRRAGGRKARRMVGRRFNGRVLPQRFMVVAKRKGWVKVQLPGRPNQSTGWLRRGSVRLQTTPYRLVVDRRANRIILLRADRVVFNRPVAVGAALTPTPAGKYYVTDVIRSQDPFYGPYALGTSAHSRVLKTYAGGPGQLGIHGTNRPGSIGRDVSHGCIRVDNRTIRRLARTVPLGTPVSIR